MAYTGFRVVFDLRRALVDKLLKLPTPYYDMTPGGVVQSKLTFDAHQLASGRVQHDHHRHPQHDDDPGELRPAHVLQLAADALDVRDPAGGRRGDPLFQPAAAAHRARRADAHRRADARAGGDDRRPSHRAHLRRRGLRARPRGQGRQRAAQLDVEAVVGQRGQLADHADPRGARGGGHHLDRDGPERGRQARPADLPGLHRRRCSRCSSA